MLRSDVCLFIYPACFARWQQIAVMTTVQRICRQANANLFSLLAARLQLQLQVSCSCERRAAPVHRQPNLNLAASAGGRARHGGTAVAPCARRADACPDPALRVGHCFFRCRFASVLSAGRAPAERARAARLWPKPQHACALLPLSVLGQPLLALLQSFEELPFPRFRNGASLH